MIVTRRYGKFGMERNGSTDLSASNNQEESWENRLCSALEIKKSSVHGDRTPEPLNRRRQPPSQTDLLNVVWRYIGTVRFVYTNTVCIPISIGVF